MRRSHILFVNLHGVATEAIKNVVLAGVGKVTILDEGPVTPADLSAGFLLREDEIGMNRATAALPRIQALNPLVKLETTSDFSILRAGKDSVSKHPLLQMGVNSLVVTLSSTNSTSSWTQERLIELNNLARALGLPFHLCSSQGFGGFYFSDLGPRHEYIVTRPAAAGSTAAPSAQAACAASTSTPQAAEPPPDERNKASQPSQQTSEKTQQKRIQEFVTLEQALASDWKGKKRVRISPGVWATWALWRYTSRQLASEQRTAPARVEDFTSEIDELLEAKGVSQRSAFEQQGVDKNAFISTFLAAHDPANAGELSPVCAILGGVLAQDLLNALGGREEPVCNWLQLEGLAGKGPVHSIGTRPSQVLLETRTNA
ncbi:SMT3/SUMO-activating complex, AOS1/RAD31 component [Ceraceosorus bombacis]|uniref:SMT3/SUMO-activating complex, AOS1/RAD31 component n=1 Tax=Ceraceosorus bombacis TaxID=401625 RepID=A0A0P1BJF0_9BASI|nr:SMT3/SUMO-activating complex, AOS1/RAD31 component [Ceraceosorus bombacis]